MAHTFEIYRDSAGDYRVRYKYGSEVMFATEAYASKASALNAIESMRKNGPGAPVDDLTDEIESLRRRLRDVPVPAADRVVRLDHNSKVFEDFKVAFEKLEEGLRTSNDIRGLSSNELDAAKSEVAQIGIEYKRQWIRPSHLWRVARSTLLWLAEKLVDAVVGALALTALAALATLLGIQF